VSVLVYFDTSAVAKWYLNEPRSEDVEEYLRSHGPAAVSWLTIVEMRSLLARRRREGNFGPEIEWRVFATFEEDLRAGHLVLFDSRGDTVAAAVKIISELNDIALRTLDALHLALAQGMKADSIATADRVMAEATQRLGFGLISFR
jgi:predicted nucleic acid-binding protein